MVANTETCVVEQHEIEKPIQAVDGSTEPVVITDEDFEKAQKLFQQGKKNLLLSKYDEATNNIADACKTYSIKYGELNYNCADVYFYYGKALLELARVENTVLGNALSGVPEDTEPINDSRYGNPDTVPEEERNEIFDKVIDAMCEENKEEKKDEAAAEPMSTDAVEVDGEKKEEVKEEEKKVEEAPKEENGEKAEVTTEKKEGENGESVVEEKKEENGEEENGEEEEGEEEEGEDVEECEKTNKDDEEDITNLQQSWEMFELAKVIYTKQKDLITDEEEKLKSRMRIAECMLKLGEIGIEQEFFEQAINDVKESIRIQEDEIKVNERDERLLAESYYQLTLAYQFNNQFELAKESHNKATNILYLRIEKLKARLTEEGLEDCIKTQINEEIREIEQLLPEMCAKLEEISEQGQQSLNLIKEAKECFASGKINIESNGTNGANGSVEVKDITGLVKSKRKLSTDKIETIEETKPEATNGTHVEVTEQETSVPAKRRLSSEDVDSSSKKTKVEEDTPVVAETAATTEPVVVEGEKIDTN